MPSPEDPPQRSAAGPAQTLSLGDAVGIVVGLVIGAGIFKTPSLVAANTGTEWVMIAVWVAGGVVSVIGALCYAELATAYPHAGGDYHFVGRAFGRELSFLYAWARMTVIAAGSIALLAFVFGDYCTRLFPLGEHSPAVYAALLVSALTGVNIVGIRAGKRTQNWLTVCEVGGLVIVVIAGLFLAPATAPAQTAVADRPWYAGVGLSMIFVLLTYGGWNEAAYVSAEVKDRNRNIIRSLLLSLGVVTVLYVLVNIAYLRGLGMAAMSKSDVVAADLLARVWGENGARLISLIIAVSTLTSVNATIIVGARSNFALGREWPLFSFLARWDSASGAPRNSYVFQAAIALGLILLGALTRKNFETMVDYTAPVFWAFFLLVGLSLFVLRTHEPERERPFRVPFFPVTPLVFVLSCFYLLYSSLAYTGVGALVGVGVLATGAVVMLFGRQRARA